MFGLKFRTRRSQSRCKFGLKEGKQNPNLLTSAASFVADLRHDLGESQLGRLVVQLPLKSSEEIIELVFFHFHTSSGNGPVPVPSEAVSR